MSNLHQVLLQDLFVKLNEQGEVIDLIHVGIFISEKLLTVRM